MSAASESTSQDPQKPRLGPCLGLGLTSQSPSHQEDAPSGCLTLPGGSETTSPKPVGGWQKVSAQGLPPPAQVRGQDNHAARTCPPSLPGRRLVCGAGRGSPSPQRHNLTPTSAPEDNHGCKPLSGPGKQPRHHPQRHVFGLWWRDPSCQLSTPRGSSPGLVQWRIKAPGAWPRDAKATAGTKGHRQGL